MKTAEIRHRPAYFNSVAFAHIPESWDIIPDDGTPAIGCDDEQDAREVAKRFGYRVTRVTSHATSR